MKLLTATMCIGLCTSWTHQAADDEAARIAWLEEHALRIASIDPDHHDFSDLQALKAAIGEARVVQLGEQSHGDGAVFLAKCRLVRFLHQEMGFDVLVWESGVFDCRAVNRGLQDPEMPVEDAWKNGLFGIWALSAQVRPVLEYVRAVSGTERPLEVAGYDCQLSSGDTARWLDAMERLMRPLGDEHPSRRVLDAIRRNAGVLSGSAQSEAQAEGVIQGLHNLAGLLDASHPALIEAHGEEEVNFLRRTIDDCLATARMTLAFQKRRRGEQASLNDRDQRMGENLIWLANERYSGRKLIVWAATMHQVHDVEAIRPSFNQDMYKDTASAGSVANGVLGDDMYTIGFDAHEGMAGICFGHPGPVAPSPPGSLGALLAQIDHPFLYVEFRALPAEHWLRQPIVARPLGYAPMDAVWPRQLDGIFFIRTMFPSTQRERAPEGAVLRVGGG
jgi:erythromycin esterase